MWFLANFLFFTSCCFLHLTFLFFCSLTSCWTSALLVLSVRCVGGKLPLSSYVRKYSDLLTLLNSYWADIKFYADNYFSPTFWRCCFIMFQQLLLLRDSCNLFDLFLKKLFFSPVLLRYIWHTALWKFKGYSIRVWFTYNMKGLSQ